MSRNPGTGVYSLPSVYLAVPGQPILASSSNTTLVDIQTTFNDPWPVDIGGTGGTSAITAWDSINKRGTDIPTASSIDLDLATGPNLHLTGAVTVATVGLANGAMRFVTADSAFQLTASANLVVNGSTTINYPVPAGALLTFAGGASSVVRVYVTNAPNVVPIGSQLLLPDGTVGAPALAFTLDPDTGLYRIGANNIGVAVNGAKVLDVGTSGLSVTGSVTASTSLVASAGTLSVSSTAAGTIGTLTSTDAGATAAPVLELVRNSASPAANDFLGNLTFTGKNASAGSLSYAQVYPVIVSPTAAAETSVLNLLVVANGAQKVIQITGDTSGNVILNLSTASGGQIQFPGVQNPSSNVNTLDDYEEGTWTPTITFGGGSTGLTYGTRTGTYTKIGNLVALACSITLSAKGSSTGAFALATLPFTPAVDFAAIPNLGTSLYTEAGSGIVVIGASGSTSMSARQQTTSGQGSTGGVSDATFSNTSVMNFTCVYMV